MEFQPLLSHSSTSGFETPVTTSTVASDDEGGSCGHWSAKCGRVGACAGLADSQLKLETDKISMDIPCF